MLLTFSVYGDKLLDQRKTQTIRPNNEHYKKFQPGTEHSVWWRNPRLKNKLPEAEQPYRMGRIQVQNVVVKKGMGFTYNDAIRDGFDTLLEMGAKIAQSWNLTDWEFLTTEFRIIQFEWIEGPNGR